MKKFLLSMLGVLIALPGIARDFTYEYEGQTLTYSILDEEAKTCGTKEGIYYEDTPGNSVSGVLEIPAIAKDGDVEYTVISIGDKAFYRCSDLTSVTIPNSVTSIGERAFGYCTGLTSVPFPNSVTSIGSYAFEDCSGLTSVTIPESVTSIGNHAFFDCSGLKTFTVEDGQNLIAFEENALLYAPIDHLYIGRNWSNSVDHAISIEIMSVEIGNSVTRLPNYAFKDCLLLTSVTIPTSVTSIGIYAFYGCWSLTSVTIPTSVTSIGRNAFGDCTGLKKSAYPSGLNNPFLEGIAIKYPREDAIMENGFVYGPEKNAIYFAPLSLKGEYVIPNSVISIGENAFYGCSGLTSVTATNANPPLMNDNSFVGLYATVALKVPKNAISDYLATNWGLFKNLRIDDSGSVCNIYETGNLKYRLIPGKTKEDKNLAVVIPGDYSSLTEVTIPERFTVTENGDNFRYYVDGIGFKAFNGCTKLATITFNSRNESRFIGDYAFAGTKIATLSIPATVETIGNHAFDGCTALTGITIPGSVESVGDYAFNSCTALSKANLEAGVRQIGDFAFYDTSSLKEITLNEGLESIGEKCFSASRDRNIEPVYIPSTLTSVGTDAFMNFNCEYVNISDLTAWCNIDFDNSNSNPAAHRQGLYLNGEIIENLVIPETVNAIKDYAFCYNSTLKSVTFSEALQSIGAEAFKSCGTISTVVIPGNVTAIGEKAFNGSNVRDLTFEYGPKDIDIASDAFPAPSVLSWDRPIGSLNLSMGSLAALTIGNSVTEIPAAKFKGVSSLTSLTLGNSLTSIGDKAFSGCTALTEVILPPSVETIGASAFDGNSKLTSIIMGHNVKTIGEKAYNLCAAQTVSITAQTPPTAPDNTFSNYTGSLYVQGQKAVDAYYDADYCWYQFEGHVMIEPTEMTVEGNKTLTGKPGDTFQLKATLYPEDVTLPYVFWRSTNPDIATVDANGLVTLHADMSEVMAMAADDDASANSCKIIAESLYADGPVAEFTVNNITTGIEDVIYDGGTESGDIDFSAPVEVFNLQGMRVAHSVENLANGIYIVRQGKNVRKIAVK